MDVILNKSQLTGAQSAIANVTMNVILNKTKLTSAQSVLADVTVYRKLTVPAASWVHKQNKLSWKT